MLPSPLDGWTSSHILSLFLDADKQGVLQAWQARGFRVSPNHAHPDLPHAASLLVNPRENTDNRAEGHINGDPRNTGAERLHCISERCWVCDNAQTATRNEQ